MNILYIAYSCAPFKGSEDQIGWNVSFKSSKTNRVFVITKTEHREAVEKFMQECPDTNIHFDFVDIPRIYKYAFKGFLYSGRLNIWHRKAYKIAKNICKQENIDIVHQITPIEFRSIGNYGKIPNVKFVAGPLGGAERLPNGLTAYAKGHMSIEYVRMLINGWYRFRFKITGKLKKCDYLMYANRETFDFLEGSEKQRIVSEIAIDPKDIWNKNRAETSLCVFLCAGRLIYRKGHNLLFDALEMLPDDAAYECHIVGKGPESERLQNRISQSEKLQKHVVFTGAVPFTEMPKEYQNADILVLPSIRETTGSVILEAMAKGIPVVTIEKFGGATLVDEETGWLYSGETKEDYILNLKNALLYCIEHPEEVRRKGKNAQAKAGKYTWDEKIKRYHEIYKSVVS